MGGRGRKGFKKTLRLEGGQLIERSEALTDRPHWHEKPFSSPIENGYG